MSKRSLQQKMMPTVPPDCSITTLDLRPDIWDTINASTHPLAALWPVWSHKSKSYMRYFNLLGKTPSLARFQIVILQTDTSSQESVIASGHTVPFFWPEISNHGRKPPPECLATLPDGGFDTILARGVLQAHARGELSLGSTDPLTSDQELDLPKRHRTETPNTLSALEITVRPDRRELGLAVIVMNAMKTLARQDGLQLLVVPLRPTRKHEFCTVDMADYIQWKLGPGHSPITSNPEENRASQAFDPWLRKHLRFGGRIIKVAKTSSCVHAKAVHWQEWTGLDLIASVEGNGSTDVVHVQQTSDEPIIEVPFEGGLSPLRFYIREQAAWYIEPNVWVCHFLDD